MVVASLRESSWLLSFRKAPCHLFICCHLACRMTANHYLMVYSLCSVHSLHSSDTAIGGMVFVYLHESPWPPLFTRRRCFLSTCHLACCMLAHHYAMGHSLYSARSLRSEATAIGGMVLVYLRESPCGRGHPFPHGAVASVNMPSFLRVVFPSARAL